MDRIKDYIDEIEGVLRYKKWLKDNEEVVDYDMDDDITVLVSHWPEYDEYREYLDAATADDIIDADIMEYEAFCEANTTDTWRTLPDYLSEEIRDRLEGF